MGGVFRDGGLTRRADRILKQLRGSPQDFADIGLLEGQVVTPAERAVLATSRARGPTVVSSFHRAFVGPRPSNASAVKGRPADGGGAAGSARSGVGLAGPHPWCATRSRASRPTASLPIPPCRHSEMSRDDRRNRPCCDGRSRGRSQLGRQLTVSFIGVYLIAWAIDDSRGLNHFAFGIES